MDRASLEKRATEIGLKFDGRTSDAKLLEAITEAGKKAMASTPDQGNRFAEPQGQDRFVPVEEPEPFKANPEGDKIKQEVKTKEKLFPVKLLKNYRPISLEAQIQDETSAEYRPLTEEEAMKVEKGNHIALPVDEAKDVIANKIAERNDPVA